MLCCAAVGLARTPLAHSVVQVFTQDLAGQFHVCVGSVPTVSVNSFRSGCCIHVCIMFIYCVISAMFVCSHTGHTRA